MKVIGITGGIGSGKSTVARILGEMGAVIIDVDKVGHEALKPGSEAWKQVIKEFGQEIVAESGEIDRSRLGKLVFNSPGARANLNRIMHPVIFKMVNDRLEEYRRKGVGVVVLEAPLMVEVGKTSQVDEVWVTVAPEATVLKRITERTGLSEAEARARIKSQVSNEERIKYADAVIDTDCSLDELRAKVAELWKKLQK